MSKLIAKKQVGVDEDALFHSELLKAAATNDRDAVKAVLQAHKEDCKQKKEAAQKVAEAKQKARAAAPKAVTKDDLREQQRAKLKELLALRKAAAAK